MIPISQAPISISEIIQSICADLLDKSNGIYEFKKSLSEYLNCENIFLVNSGSSALYFLLKSYDLKNDDEVILPAYLCENVPKLLFSMGLKIKFVDIEPFTYNMDPDDLNEKISRKTKAVLAVHMFGFPCRIKEISEISHDAGATVIEDAAQAMGAEYDNQKVGTIGNSGFFSLGVGKVITTINGGVICTNDNEITETVSKYVAEFKKDNLSNQAKFIFNLVGYNLANSPKVYSLIYKKIRHERSRCDTIELKNFMYKYSNIQSNLGMFQLNKIDIFNKKRFDNANYLMKNIEKDGISFPRASVNTKPIFLRLPMIIKNIEYKERDALIKKFENAGLETSKYMNISLPQLFNETTKECPISEKITRETITLPTHPNVLKSDLDLMIKVMKESRD